MWATRNSKVNFKNLISGFIFFTSNYLYYPPICCFLILSIFHINRLILLYNNKASFEQNVTLYKRIKESPSTATLSTTTTKFINCLLWNTFILYHNGMQDTQCPKILVKFWDINQSVTMTMKYSTTLLEKESKFPRYNMKCWGNPNTAWTIPRSVTFSPLHFMLYRRKLITFGTVYTVPKSS